jgi:hypothetical protein
MKESDILLTYLRTQLAQDIADLLDRPHTSGQKIAE